MEPNVLSRRIEQLAALAVDDSYGAPSIDLLAVLSAVRSEVAGLRGDLGELRGELGSVRTDLDGLSGRLTGSVAASRTETGTLVRRVADLANRVEAVGGRVEEVRTDLPALSREVREALEQVPARTGNRLEELSTGIGELVGARVEAVSADVRRSLLAAQEREATSVAAARSGLDEARASLESRMAALEDALDAMAGNLEAVTRDGLRTTRDLLRTTADSVAAIEGNLATTAGEQVEQLVARLRDATETRLNAQSDQLAETLRQRGDQTRRDLLDSLAPATADSAAVRAQVAELSEQVRRDQALTQEVLADLARAVAQALRGMTDDVHTELDEVAERLLVGLADAQRSAAAHVCEQAAESRGHRTALEALRTHVSDGAAGLRADVGSELAALRPEVAALSVELAAAVRAQGETRSELAGMVVEVREQLRASAEATAAEVRTTLSQQSSRAAELASAGLSALRTQAQEHRDAMDRRLSELVAATTDGTAELGRLTAELKEVRATQRATDKALATSAAANEAARAKLAKDTERALSRTTAQAEAALARTTTTTTKATATATARPAKAGAVKGGPSPTAARKPGTTGQRAEVAGADVGRAEVPGPEADGADLRLEAGRAPRVPSPPAGQAATEPGTAGASASRPKSGASAARRGRLDAMPEVPSPTVALNAATGGPTRPAPLQPAPLQPESLQPDPAPTGESLPTGPVPAREAPAPGAADGRRRFGRRKP